MIIYLLFIFLLLLENIFLPALTGLGFFLITPLFVISVFMYSRGWKPLIFKAVPFILIEEIFTGIGFGEFLLPMFVTWLIYFWLNRFINIGDQFRENISFAGIAVSLVLLAVFGNIYSWLFIFINNNYNFYLSSIQFKLFFTSSFLSVLGWSAAVSILFKYALK